MEAEHLPILPSWPEMLHLLLITQFDIAMRIEPNVAPSILIWNIYTVVLNGKKNMYIVQRFKWIEHRQIFIEQPLCTKCFIGR